VGVVNAVPGSSAARAGLSTGDMLEAINNVATRDMPLAYAEMLLNGEPGTSVEISVLRVRKPEPQKITLTRAIQRQPAVTSRMLPDQIGLVQVPSLDAGKVKDAAAQLDQLTKQGAKKYILDLRSSAVGKPDEGVGLANLFLDKGLITYLQGQKQKREDYNADPSRAVYKDQPLVVLTNRGTAGAAEVAAAALLDNKRAELVGERTYGDAAVRRAIQMDDGSAVILSVAKYYSPAGKALQDTPTTPTFLVTEADLSADTDDDENPPAPPSPEQKKDDDAVLKKAIEVLTKGKAAEGATGAAASPAPGQDKPEIPPLVDKKK
jgi:carboxyl-terminal processing protease